MGFAKCRAGFVDQKLTSWVWLSPPVGGAMENCSRSAGGAAAQEDFAASAASIAARMLGLGHVDAKDAGSRD
jgi:hypothetical protein